MNKPGQEASRCGSVAFAGRPNVGKTTLLNHLLGRKLAITSRKPQTTRHALAGVRNHGAAQLILIDTPGIHDPKGRALNRYMMNQAVGSLTGVDLVVLMIEAQGWRSDDDMVLRRIREAAAASLCAVNKIDRLHPKERLLPLIDEVRAKHDFLDIVPISALKNIALDELADAIAARLPLGEHLYPDDAIADRPLRFQVAEIVREKVVRRLGAELPHQTAVTVEEIVARDGYSEIHALLYVERESQKRIAIGKRGAMLKSIGEEARKDIEMLIDGKAMLRLWVKVAPRWSDRETALRQLGYR